MLPERLSTIHDHLHKLREAAIDFIPRVVQTRWGTSHVEEAGCLWEVSTWLDGEADLTDRVSTNRRRAAARALAKIHRQWQEENSHPRVSPGLVERFERLKIAQGELQKIFPDSLPRRSLIANRAGVIALDCVEEINDLARRTISHVHRASERLLNSMDKLSYPVDIHFVIRDLHREHVLFDGDRLTGIIDFGAARRDEPLLDLVRLLGTLSPFDRLDRYEALKFYTEEMHEPNSRWFQVDMVVLFARFAVLDEVSTLLSACHWLDWLVVQPRPVTIPLHHVVRRWTRFLARLDQSQW